MLKRRGLVAAAIVAATLLPGFGALTHPAAASSTTRTIAQNTDMFIYDPTGARLLGRAHYTVTQHDDVVTIEGRNDFIDGERDVEHDTLRAVDGGVPRMITYQHDFFDEHGAPQITASADAVSGKSSCGKYEDGKGTIETAVLQYPPDTYAGAGVLVPVADRLRRGGTELDIHVFDCALGPRILTLHADLTRETMALPPPRRRVGQGRRASGVRLVQCFSEALRADDPDVVRPFARLRFRRRHAVALLSRSRGLAGECQNRAEIAAGIRAARAAVAHGAH